MTLQQFLATRRYRCTPAQKGFTYHVRFFIEDLSSPEHPGDWSLCTGENSIISSDLHRLELELYQIVAEENKWLTRLISLQFLVEVPAETSAAKLDGFVQYVADVLQDGEEPRTVKDKTWRYEE